MLCPYSDDTALTHSTTLSNAVVGLIRHNAQRHQSRADMGFRR